MVCGEHCRMKDSLVLDVDDIPNVDMLKNTDIQTKPLLYLGDLNDDGKGHCCNKCLKLLSLPVPRIPFNSMYSNWFGDNVPLVLRDLTVPEIQLISPIITKCHVIKLVVKDRDRVDLAQRAVKGNSIAFIQDTPELIKQLPKLSVCSEFLRVCFVGKKENPNSIPEVKRIIRVRRQKVSDALEWLCKNSVAFKNNGITIDYDELNRLPDDGILDNVLDNMTYTDDVNNEKKESAGYIRNDAVGSSMTRCGVIDIDACMVNQMDMSRGAEKNMREDVVYMNSSSKPVSSWEHPDFFGLAFPSLFPLGSKSMNMKNIKKWTTHLLMCHDARFRRHYTFMFYLFNVINVMNVCRSARFAVSRDIDDGLMISSDKLEEVVKSMKSGSLLTDPAAIKLMSRIRTVGSHVRGSDFERNRLSLQIRALMIELGLPSFFITINPSDTNHPLCVHYGDTKVNLDNPFKENWKNSYERMKMVGDDPVACARFFNTMIESVLCNVLGINKSGVNDIGVLGRVSGHFGTVETQGRGTLHFHLLLWIEGSLSPDVLATRLSDDSLFKDLFLEYVSNTMSCDIPDIPLRPDESVVSAGNTEHICCQKPPDPREEDFDFLYNRDVNRLIKSSNINTHSFTCYKYGYD